MRRVVIVSALAFARDPTPAKFDGNAGDHSAIALASRIASRLLRVFTVCG